MIEVKEDLLKRIYRKRDPWSHKYNFGHLLVIGGSKRYSGSPAFNALAALKAGVDLVTVAAPERAADIIASFSPDLIAYPLKGNYLNLSHLNELINLTENKDAVVIGGGLCRGRKTLKLVIEYLRRIEIPCVIDADAIHAVAKNKSIIKNKRFVVTPHAYEFYILSGITVGNNLRERMESVKKVAERLKTTILLKGHVDIISNGREVAVNRSGTPLMTKGGMGDTLAGIIGALLARKVNCFDAACAAAYINGKAGELAAKKFGESILASDILNEIHKVLPRQR